MKKKLVWRLGKLPTVEELLQLVKDKIITQDEAKEILFNNETEEDRDKESLKSEIKFLRELIEKLSERQEIIKIIETIKPTYIQKPWYEPYYKWTCQANDNVTYCSSSSSALNLSDSSVSNNFVNIKTF